MENIKGFWSYVHDDDTTEGGMIIRLAQDIQNQYEMIAGEKITLFVDRDALEWGMDWRNGIDTGLLTTAYFIPVITPRFFKSVECRRELQTFAKQAEQLGLRDLIMPILYVHVPELDLDSTGDKLMDLVKTYQWEDWTDLRFAASDSPEYRRAVARLASKLADVNRKMDEEVSSSSETPKIAPDNVEVLPKTEDEDLTPGSMDLISDMEETLPEWTETINEISAEITTIGGIFTRGSSKITKLDKRNANYSDRLAAIKVIAKELKKPAENINELGSKFNSHLYKVDLGIKVIADQIKSNPHSTNNPQSEDFIKSIREFDTSVDSGLSSLEGMLTQMEPLEGMSRDLRYPLKRMRKGLTLMLEGREIVKDWVKILES